MFEVSSLKKTRVNLCDYDFMQDIQNRIHMSDFSVFDVEVLEEILFSPLKISLKKLERSLDCSEKKLQESIEKLLPTQLFTLEQETLLVDKEKRRIFELEIMRFDPCFKPGVDFIHGLLKKIPIPLLPVWYAVPRTSNNIFESIIEKYLLTPYIFQRYIEDLHYPNPIIPQLVETVFASPDLKVSTSDLIAKFNLSRLAFEEMLLFLEFNFICCLSYEKEGDVWIESVTPFYEWKEYLSFLKATEAPPIENEELIEKKRSTPFAFIETMSALLEKAKEAPFPTPLSSEVEKLRITKLASYENGVLHFNEPAEAWLDLSLENRALYLYRNPNNQILETEVGEKCIREADKVLQRALHGKWVFFDDFIKGALVPLSEHSVIALKKSGKLWKYSLPVYSEEEKKLLKAIIFQWLYELGMVMVGKCQGRDCFAVTHFGRFFFDA